MADSEPIYREAQVFSNLTRRVAVPVVLLLSVGVIGGTLVTQLIFGQRLGKYSFTDLALAIFGIVSILVGVLLTLFLIRSKLLIDVLPDRLYVCLRPRQKQFHRVPLERVVNVEPRVYLPIKEFGGWGLRRGLYGRCITLRGDKGVHLTFDDGARLLIGTDRPEELAIAIRHAKENLPSGPESSLPELQTRV